MSTSFPVGPTRQVQPGDTPDLNDGLLSRPQSAFNIARGQACYMVAGFVTIATAALAATGVSPFVPIESIDNSGGAAGATEMSGVTAPQRVALTFETITNGLTLFPGDYVKIGTAGIVTRWKDGEVNHLKYARFLGIEASLLNKNISSPFGETLTPGIVPDQSVTGENGDTFVGWFQLMENPGA